MDKRRRNRWAVLGAVAASALLIGPAGAQIGGLGRPMAGSPFGAASPLGGALPRGLGAEAQGLGSTLGRLDPQALLDQRVDRLDALVRAHPREIERDDRGAPVVRGVVLAIAPTEAALTTAKRAGFAVETPAEPDSAIAMVVLRAPQGMTAREAVRRLRKLDPSGAYDFNHLYQPSGAVALAAAGGGAGRSATARTARIGLIDTGVDASTPALAHGRIEQKGFAGAAGAGGHGTAVASLLVGDSGAFRGAAPGGELIAADVYGDGPTGGAADALVRGLGWLASRQVKVVNISLVGPPNLALRAAVTTLQARGVVLVAAVGNDGPAAPAAYPASYPGVIAVTAVDAQDRVLLEAGRAEHLDFAAPGADMAAAARGGGYAAVRGTSFAAPLVAGSLAALLANPERTPAEALTALAANARRGRGYGRGLVAMEQRTPPAKLGVTTAPTH